EEFTAEMGWNTHNVLAPVTLAPGKYWLAFLASDGAIRVRVDQSTGSIVKAEVPFGPLPEGFPFPTGRISASWSFYATLAPAACWSAGVPLPAGTPCSDGNACNGLEKCDGMGHCAAGVPLNCTMADACHQAGTCDPATGCSNASRPEGTPCD